ncbi:hypothetical protein ACJJTC_012759 [Scirpophaga incertulas]
MHLLIALLLTVTAVSAVPNSPSRIVGGATTNINSYPTMVALLYSPDAYGHRQACGGTIINDRSVLTASHCNHRDHPSQWVCRFGSTYANSGGVVYASRAIINHSNYNPSTNDNDIAIIRVSGTIRFSNMIQPARFAGASYIVKDNEPVWASGWGVTQVGGSTSEQLRHVQIWTVNQAVCRNRYAGIRITITDNMMCSGWMDVGGRDQCQGDSGGPLFHKGTVVGVCSFGEGCAHSYYPGINTRVSRYTSWIQANA